MQFWSETAAAVWWVLGALRRLQRASRKAQAKADKNLAAQSMKDIYGAPVDILAAAKEAAETSTSTSYDHPADTPAGGTPRFKYYLNY